MQTPALVESFVAGREIYVGVLGNSRLKVLPPWELDLGSSGGSSGQGIATRRVKFDKKYGEKHGIQRGPAKEISPVQLRRLETLCKQSFRVLKLNGYARMDLRLDEQGNFHFIEVNPNPELAKGEDFANAALLAGISYPQLIRRIVKLGQQWDLARSLWAA